MFTVAEREALRGALIEFARADPRLTGVALFGSATTGREDAWSDVDLAFGVDGPLEPVMDDWTARMYAEHGAVDHLDMHSGPSIYRVFLLASTLQVDLAFSPSASFGALAPTFQLLDGEAMDQGARPPDPPDQRIGMAWLYALHARSAIERGRFWQAEEMIAAVRHHVLALACSRHGLPAAHGKGSDELPAAVTASLANALPRSLEAEELRRAFRAAMTALRAESPPALAGPLTELAS